MISQKKVSRSNTKSQLSLLNKRGMGLNWICLKLYAYYLNLKLSWIIFKLRWKKSFRQSSSVAEHIKQVGSHSTTSSRRSTPAADSKLLKDFMKRVGNPKS